MTWQGDRIDDAEAPTLDVGGLCLLTRIRLFAGLLGLTEQIAVSSQIDQQIHRLTFSAATGKREPTSFTYSGNCSTMTL